MNVKKNIGKAWRIMQRQIDKLYDMFKERGSLTGWDILNAGIMNYKGRVADLRKLGIHIETKMEEVEKRDGEKTRVARYYYKGD